MSLHPSASYAQIQIGALTLLADLIAEQRRRRWLARRLDRAVMACEEAITAGGGQVPAEVSELVAELGPMAGVPVAAPATIAGALDAIDDLSEHLRQQRWPDLPAPARHRGPAASAGPIRIAGPTMTALAPKEPGQRASGRMTTDAEDLALVERARAGDQEAWRLLWRAHHAALFGFALKRVNQNAADAEDVCGAVWERFVQDVRRGRRGVAPRRWLLQLTRWELWEAHHQSAGRDVGGRHAFRRRAPHVGLDEIPPGASEPVAPVDVAAEAAGRLEVDRLLGTLTPAERRSVAARYVLDLDTSAAAARLGSTPGAVVQNCVAGRRRLRRLIAS